jgi:dephospho-CoA kinase
MLDKGIIKIALCGGMRSGKDAVGELLVKYHNFRRYAFGKAIKELCQYYFPERMEGGKDRKLFQGVGQDLRKYDEDIWVKAVFEEIRETDTWPAKNIVITDLRQPNEYKAVRAEGFHIVRVNASPEARQRRAEAAGDVFHEEDMQHETESHFEGFTVDYELHNDGDLDQLTQYVETMIEYLAAGGAKYGIR